MASGKVKWFNDEKGWGFIKQDIGPDVFVHYSQIHGEGRRRLFEDEMVEFEIKEGPKVFETEVRGKKFVLYNDTIIGYAKDGTKIIETTVEEPLHVRDAKHANSI